MKSHCKRFKALAVSNFKDTPQNLMVVPLRCRMWDCPYCAWKNRTIWRAHIIDRINALGGEWIFITFTAHKNAHRAAKTLENLKRGWKLLYDRLRRYFKPHALEYLMLYEKHSSKNPELQNKIRYHVHAVVRAELPGENVYDRRNKRYYHPAFTRWLKDNSAGVGCGYQCHAAKIASANGGLVAAYITKYMTKAAQDFGEFPKRMRRIGVSRGVGSPKMAKSPETWRLRAGIVRLDVEFHDRVIDVATGEVIPLEYFNFHDVYPEKFDPAYEDEYDSDD